MLITASCSRPTPMPSCSARRLTAADRRSIDRYVAAEHAFTVDPVDGTKNFVHGSPDHAVMVAETVGGETVRGWIWQPEHEVPGSPSSGAGIQRNGERVPAHPVRRRRRAPRGHVDLVDARPLASATCPRCAGRGSAAASTTPGSSRARPTTSSTAAQQPVGPRAGHADGHRGRRLRRPPRRNALLPALLTPGSSSPPTVRRMPPCSAGWPPPSRAEDICRDGCRNGRRGSHLSTQLDEIQRRGG